MYRNNKNLQKFLNYKTSYYQENTYRWFFNCYCPYANPLLTWVESDFMDKSTTLPLPLPKKSLIPRYLNEWGVKATSWGWAREAQPPLGKADKKLSYLNSLNQTPYIISWLDPAWLELPAGLDLAWLYLASLDPAWVDLAWLDLATNQLVRQPCICSFIKLIWIGYLWTMNWLVKYFHMWDGGWVGWINWKRR